MGDVETQLRELFAADATAAPEPLPGLAGAVRGRVRQARRRLAAMVVAAVGVVAVAVLVVPPLVAGAPRTVPAPLGPAGPPRAPAGSKPSVVPSGGGETGLRYRGVVIPVPAAWLDPDVLHCGTPVADAAYVIEPGQAHLFCGNSRSQSDLTAVILMPSDSPPGTEPAYAEPEKVLDDGRTQLTTAVPGAPVRIVVTSPDPVLARTLFGGLRIENELAGCALHRPWQPPGEAGVGDPLARATTGPVALCTYTNGWLRAWGWLDEGRSRELVGLLRSAPEGSPPADACVVPGAGQAYWVAQVPLRGRRTAEVRVTVSCPGAAVYVAGGPVRRVTTPLLEALEKDGPGISVAAGVVDPVKR